MSNRERRSTTQPNSYKDFSETGRKNRAKQQDKEERQEDETESELTDNTSVSQSQSTGESEDSTEIQFKDNANANQTGTKCFESNSKIRSAKASKTMQNRERAQVQSRSVEHAITPMHQHVQQGKQSMQVTPTHAINEHDNSTMTTKCSQPKKTIASQGKHSKHSNLAGQRDDPGTSHSDDILAIAIDPEDDDLDTDKSAHVKSKSSKKTGHTSRSPGKRNTINQSKVKSLSKRLKMSVATRLTYMIPPTINNSELFLSDNNSFIPEKEKTARDREAARQMLLHSQCEAELTKQQLQAEADRKQARMLQKQTDKDNKKATAERAKNQKLDMKKNKSSKGSRPLTDNEWFRAHRDKTMPVQRERYEEQILDSFTTDEEDPIEKTVKTMKKKVKMLNPLRRAQRMHTSPSGHNNPNVPGQDNGMNAWMDAQLNREELDHDMHNEARYAKRNSDYNKCYDIDDIPQHGPPNVEDIPSDISLETATNMANELLNEDNLFICRETGIMRHKKHSPKKRPQSTVTRVQHEQQQLENHRNDRWRNKRQWDYGPESYEYDRFENKLQD